VAPLFYALQVARPRTSLLSQHERFFSLGPLGHALLFCAIALYVLPLCEAFRVTAGLSPINFRIAKALFEVSLAVATLPQSFIGLVIAFKPLFSRSPLRRMTREDLIFKLQFLEGEDFDLKLLDSGPDGEINTLIEVAKYVGDMDKASLISKYLLDRHLSIS